MAETVCREPVMNLERKIEQAGQTGDRGVFEDFMHSLRDQLKGMTPGDRQSFIQELNDCNEARRRSHPELNLPNFHIGISQTPNAPI